MNRLLPAIPMKLRRDQAWLLSHDREPPLEAFQEIIDLVGRDQKGAHQHYRADIVVELLLKGDAIVEIDDLWYLDQPPARSRQALLLEVRRAGPERGGLNNFTACEWHDVSPALSASPHLARAELMPRG
jgi:hypothetical protein